MKIIVTGGAGFMGSAFVRLLVKKGLKPVVIDKLTYAGDVNRLKQVNKRIKLHKSDIRDKKHIRDIFQKVRPEVIVNLSAESHVDKSIKDPTPFLETNIKGTQSLLDASMDVGARYIHISTDEVYGEAKDDKFTEESPLSPSNPYSASKAAGDLLIKAYQRTYGFKSIIIRPCNNFGHFQHKEKFIPNSIHRVLRGKGVYLHGDGSAFREWLYVDDFASGVWAVIKKGRDGEVYNLGSGWEVRNIAVAKLILKHLGKGEHEIEYGAERPGGDYRYFLDSDKIRRLGWKPQMPFGVGLWLTVKWYKKYFLDK